MLPISQLFLLISFPLFPPSLSTDNVSSVRPLLCNSLPSIGIARFLSFKNLNWDFTYSKGFNNCYIMLSNSLQALENTKFIAGELSLMLSLMLYLPIRVYEL